MVEGPDPDRTQAQAEEIADAGPAERSASGAAQRRGGYRWGFVVVLGVNAWIMLRR